jgi:hypothetical protein
MLSLSLATASLVTLVVTPAALGLTDTEVVRAIDKAKEFLISRQGGNGLWPEQSYHAAPSPCGNSEMALFTLAYTGEHPNRPVIAKALDALMNRNLDYTYAISMRVMAYAIIQNKLASPKRDIVRNALKADVQWLIAAQGGHGGWDYTSLAGSNGRYDLSNTQMAILALREAAIAGIEIPDFVWKRTQGLYFKLQKSDGAWNYGEHNDHIGKGVPGYGSMTAAGLASIFITADNLDLASGCPCKGTVSNKIKSDLDRRIDMALDWLSKDFKASGNPKAPDGDGWHKWYWLYSVERVGIAAGYKYFGDHDWYREGAEHIIKSQDGSGAWGDIPDTCFCTLFLYKGRAPVLYNKLQFNGADGKLGEWHNHRRDIANLTAYIEKSKEQMFHWQIVNLRRPVEELHDAPVLFLTPETVPAFSDEEKKKLREFTDTGGTILIEASCGNPTIRKWVQEFAKEVWPEWPLKGLGPDHGSFLDPNPLKQRPEILGADDGIRTFLFYSMDDISCPWQTKAYAGRDYLFKWGINLFTYATDHGALRAKLAEREPAKDRYNTPIKSGPTTSLTVARLKYEGAWTAGRQYKGFEQIAKNVSKKAGINLKVEEGGVSASELANRDVAYMAVAGSAAALAPADKDALKQYLSKGGFLWLEAVCGAPASDQAIQKLAGEMGWQMKPIEKTHPLLTGTFNAGLGYNISQGVQYRRVLRVTRLGRAFADFSGIYQDGKLVGLYSPFDVVFCSTGYDAYSCRGYPQDDALAVATNIVVFLTDRTGAE